MASKRRLRRKACSGKRRYATAIEAEQAIRRLRYETKTLARMNAYRCPFCNKFHIGHTPYYVHKAITSRMGKEVK